MVAHCDSASKYGMRCIIPHCLPSRAATSKGTHNAAKVQYKLHVASDLNLLWNESMEWNMEENFSMEWKKIASMENGKIVFHSIPYEALLR